MKTFKIFLKESEGLIEAIDDSILHGDEENVHHSKYDEHKTLLHPNTAHKLLVHAGIRRDKKFEELRDSEIKELHKLGKAEGLGATFQGGKSYAKALHKHLVKTANKYVDHNGHFHAGMDKKWEVEAKKFHEREQAADRAGIEKLSRTYLKPDHPVRIRKEKELKDRKNEYAASTPHPHAKSLKNGGEYTSRLNTLHGIKKSEYIVTKHTPKEMKEKGIPKYSVGKADTRPIRSDNLDQALHHADFDHSSFSSTRRHKIVYKDQI